MKTKQKKHNLNLELFQSYCLVNGSNQKLQSKVIAKIFKDINTVSFCLFAWIQSLLYVNYFTVYWYYTKFIRTLAII